jgi:prophage regulatory protein
MRILNARQVREIVGLDRTTVWRLIRRKEFPPSIQLSPGRVGWVEAEVVEWINERVRRSRNAAPLSTVVRDCPAS